MSKYGLSIKNIKAGTLYGYNIGIRERYDFTNAMLHNSLFLDFLKTQKDFDIYKDKSTRDVICIDFDFGVRSYAEEKKHIEKNKKFSDELKERLLSQLEKNAHLYKKTSKDEIRTLFYKHGVDVKYPVFNKNHEIVDHTVIHYKMLYRNASKAKIGQVMFIKDSLYEAAHDWLTMGLGKRMPNENAMIVELSAYAPLTTSSIEDKLNIPVEDVLILDDKDSFFNTMAKVVKAKDYEVKGKISRKCYVEDARVDVKNTLWDGMGLIESSCLPDNINGMVLLRQHFFKACMFRTNMQLFFRDWCLKTNNDYNTYQVNDIFGRSHYLKDIKMITTDNAIKWKKFKLLMDEDPYNYWINRVNADGSYWGIVKTDHPSKLDDVQQMSYQMVNTLPCTDEDINDLASTSMQYVDKLKNDETVFEKFLRKNATLVNHYEMMADLYTHNNDIANTDWYRDQKKQIISNYVRKLKTGKITINADNLTLCGNPYALLLHSVGEDWQKDPTFKHEDGTIQCYTKRFDDGQYLCGIRNPHNSPNNICYLHNVYSNEIEKYFEFSPNILAVNCINTDIQSRANGADFDSDFFFVTDNNVMVRNAKKVYVEYPTIVNDLAESGIKYNNTPEAYAKMDNNFAKSRIGIGESSNLAQVAMTYYWTEPDKDLYDNFVILSVLAQIIIDGCKREYEVVGEEEIARIKKLPCMNKYGKKDLPQFMINTRPIELVKNGKPRPYADIRRDKDRLRNRINYELVCPMNNLMDTLSDSITRMDRKNRIPIDNFFITLPGKGDHKQIGKIREYIEKYSYELYLLMHSEMNQDDINYEAQILNQEVINKIQKINIGNTKTINRLIAAAFGINKDKISKNRDIAKQSTTILRILYRMNKDKFLSNFVPKIAEQA